MTIEVSPGADRVTIDVTQDGPAHEMLRAVVPHVPEGWRVVSWCLMRQPQRLTLRAERAPERWCRDTTAAVDAMRKEIDR